MGTVFRTNNNIKTIGAIMATLAKAHLPENQGSYFSLYTDPSFLHNHNMEVIEDIVIAVSHKDKDKEFNHWHWRYDPRDFEKKGFTLVSNENEFTFITEPYAVAIAVLPRDLYIEPDGTSWIITEVNGGCNIEMFNMSNGKESRVDMGYWLRIGLENLSKPEIVGRFVRGPNWPATKTFDFKQGQTLTRGRQGEVGTVLRRHANQVEINWWRQDRPQNNAGWSRVYFNCEDGSLDRIEHKSFNTRKREGRLKVLQQKTYTTMPWEIEEFNLRWDETNHCWLF